MIVLVCIFILIFLERIIPFRKLPLFRGAFLGDLGWYVFAQNTILQLCLIKFMQQFPIAHHFKIVTAYPIWLQVILVLVLFDFVTYWLHRFLHSDLMWRFHELHHSGHDVDWLSGLRNHPVDIILTETVTAVLFCMTGAAFSVAGIIAIIVTVHGLYKHSNVRNKTGVLQYFLISTEMHRLHHLRDIKFQQSNYGTILSVWDWLFGTAHYPQEEEYKDVPFGTAPDYPQNFVQGNIHVFRKMGTTAEGPTGLAHEPPHHP